MKVVKLVVCALALAFLTAPAFAGVGVMSKDDVREGQLLCPVVKAKMEREAAQARQREKQAREDSGASDATSAK